MSNLKLLREFIRENLGAMFGLDRHVSMNALQDVVGGPDPVDAPVEPPGESSYSVYMGSSDDSQASVMDHLRGNNPGEFDEPDEDLEAAEVQNEEDR